MPLWPFQTMLMDELHAHARERPVLVLPTGSGKSVVGAEVGWRVHHFKKRLLWVVHRVELVDQAIGHLRARGLEVGNIVAGRPEDRAAPIQVASIQTLLRRELPPADVLVYDECHHSCSESSKAFLAREDVRRMFWVGLTATPARLDGQGLGEAGWGRLIEGPGIGELIANGYLTPFKVFAPARPNLEGVEKTGGDYQRKEAAKRMHLVGNPVSHYQQFITGGQALLFGCTVEHSQEMVAAFRGAGIEAEHLDAKSPKEERARVVGLFRDRKLQVLGSVGLFDEGFDAPACDGVILARPTTSLTLYRQQVGRALRKSPGKAIAIVLDMAGNWERCGLPDDRVDWSLTGKAKHGAATQPWKTCRSCWAVIPIHLSVCPSCSAPCCAANPREVKHRAGELEEIRRRETSDQRTLRERRELYWKLLLEARGRGWKIARARTEYRRRTGYWVGRNEQELEAAAQGTCQHAVTEGGCCRFCGAGMQLFGGLR